MYRQAREGKVKNFTGVDDPYEAPLEPEIVIDTVGFTAEQNAGQILAYLLDQKFILPSAAEDPELTPDEESIETMVT